MAPRRTRKDDDKARRWGRTTLRDSARMERVRSRGTAPERAFEELLIAVGVPYRRHVVGLPGKPDFLLPFQRSVCMIHGCFWHQHPGCAKATLPARNRNLWKAKFSRTKVRDSQSARALRSLGYRVLVFWECQVENRRRVLHRLESNL